jgi:hypothetical protein
METVIGSAQILPNLPTTITPDTKHSLIFEVGKYLNINQELIRYIQRYSLF